MLFKSKDITVQLFAACIHVLVFTSSSFRIVKEELVNN